jgi:hypothetical protein
LNGITTPSLDMAGDKDDKSGCLSSGTSPADSTGSELDTTSATDDPPL